MTPDELSLSELLALGYRLRRYHIAEAKGKTSLIGFAELDCSTCDAELQVDRGCRRWGLQHRAAWLWRFDYHTPLTGRDRLGFCPRSILDFEPVLASVVDAALEIDELGGLGAWAGAEGVGSVDAAAVFAYKEVIAAKQRAQLETDKTSAALAKG